MKLAYQLFHLAKDVGRDKNADAVHEYMASHAKNLSSSTVGFTSESEALTFCTSTDGFAVHLRGYSPSVLTRQIVIQSLKTNTGWKLGELGIWASNFLAWQAFLESDADYLILLEDDCILEPDFMPTLTQYMEELPQDWDVYHHFAHFQDAPWYHPELSVGEHTCLAYQDWSNLCYVINRRSAQKILSLVREEGVHLPLDWFWFKQPEKLATYTVKPKMYSGVGLDSLPSTFQLTDKRLDLSNADK